MLVDTDVLIWYLKGNDKARRAIDGTRPFSISVVTYMEMVQGMRNKRELQSWRRSLRDWRVNLLYLSEAISTQAMFYVEQHYLSHSMQVADALIGATAVAQGLPMLTANDKHYRAIKEIQIRKFRP